MGPLQGDFPVLGENFRRFWPGNWRQDADCYGDAQNSSKSDMETDSDARSN